MLSDKENVAILNDAYFGGHWGDPTNGLSPHGIVAKMRGAKFEVDENGDYDIAHDDLGCVDEKSLEIAHQATVDVTEWCGFGKNTFAYTAALLKEGVGLLNTLKEREQLAARDKAVKWLWLIAAIT